MLLADLGAVVLVDRKGAVLPFATRQPKYDLTRRGKRSIAVDLKQPGAAEVVLRLIEQADGLIEGFRPGVMERLGLGPDVCLARNPRLVFGRLTGWGQNGPLAQAAGHDINYVALTGILHSRTGQADAGPRVPPTVVGDVGGGAMFMAVGIVSGILNARATGPRAGDRHGDHRRLRAHGHAAAGRARCRVAGAIGARRTPSTAARTGTTATVRRRRLDFAGRARAAVLPAAAREVRARGRRARDRAVRRRALAGAQASASAALFRTRTRDEWCALLEGTRRLLRAGAEFRRGARRIRTTSPAGRYVRSTASPSRPRRRASAPRRPGSVAARGDRRRPGAAARVASGIPPPRSRRSGVAGSCSDGDLRSMRRSGTSQMIATSTYSAADECRG